MHVLGLPPAFVLSQDQTLKLKRCHQRILDVRTSAHLQYFRSALGAEPYVHPAKDWTRIESHLFDCASGFLKKPKAAQTVKLTLDHRVETLPALIYRRRSSKRTKPPTYLFRYHQFQTAQRQKPTGCALTSWRARPSFPQNLPPRLRQRLVASSPPPRLASRCAPQRRR